mgnify:CR=1 FL=1
MTVSGGALTLAAAAIALLGMSGLWAERRYRRLDRLPAHFDVSGNPTRFAPRPVVIWFTPAVFTGALLTIVTLVTTLPGEQVRGDPDHAVIGASLIMLGAQAFVIRLVDRWARLPG